MKNIKAEDTSKFIANAITSGFKGGKASKVMGNAMTSGVSGSLKAQKLIQSVVKSAKPARGFKGEKIVSRPKTPAQLFMNTISFGLFD